MRASSTAPSGVERTFGADEIIVTKTDLRGVITYANDVFLRVSAYPEPDMLGKPHNMIRHPDMPRCVFKLLWDRIRSGQEIFAYVVNLAGDGAHYWVFAHVTPSLDAAGSVVGYHSSRRVPDRAAVDEVRALYAVLVAEERRHGRATDAVEASYALLERTLAERGLTYDEWIWSLAGRDEATGVAA